MFKFCEIEMELRGGNKYNQGWLLEISNFDDLYFWYQNRNEMIDIWSDLKSKDGQRDHFKNPKSYLYKFKIDNKMNGKCSLSDFAKLDTDLSLNSKIEMLDKYGKIYINCVGGFFPLSDNNTIKNTINLKELIYPDLGEKEFSITQFPNGTHFYISANGQSVHLEGNEKWDSYNEAKDAIKKHLKSNKKIKSKKDIFNE